MVDSLKLSGKVNTVPQTNDITAPKNIAFRGTSKLERTPQDDSFEKQGMSTGAKVALGTAIAVAAGVALDYAFAHGKHVKSLLGIADDAGKQAAEAGDDAARAVEGKADDLATKAGKEAETVAEQAERTQKPALTDLLDNTAEQVQAKSTSLKEQLIKDGNMNFTIKVDGNEVIVENGKISKLVNSEGAPWSITKDTDANFVAKINAEVEKKINSIITTHTPYSKAELYEQLWSKKMSDLKPEQQERLLNTILPQENVVARSAIQKCMNAGEGHVHEYVLGLEKIKTNLEKFVGEENVAGIFRSEAVMTKPIKDLKLGDVITNFEAKPELFKGYSKDTSLVSFLESIGNQEFKAVVSRNTEKPLLESTELLSYLIKHYNG